MKTVIQVYSCNYAKKSGYHGFGDFLRSCYGMYKLSKLYNFNLIVDFSLHPIGSYLKENKHKYSCIVKENKNNINMVSSNHINYINNSDKDVVINFFWMGLSVYNTPMTSDESDFLKNIIKPTKSTQEIISLKLSEIPYTNFNIIHYRLGDFCIFNNNTNNNADKYLTHIKNRHENNSVLISDSSHFKEYIKNNNVDVFTYDHNICHLGFCEDSNNVLDNLMEFFIMTRASKIKSYSIYSWESGFAKMASLIYDIKLETETRI
jgi:hypothetical protein